MSDNTTVDSVSPEYTGGFVFYYRVAIQEPTNPNLAPYVAECNDITEALGMNYAEDNAFKAIWRRAAAHNLGLSKAGYKDGLYDAQKIEFFGGAQGGPVERRCGERRHRLKRGLQALGRLKAGT